MLLDVGIPDKPIEAIDKAHAPEPKFPALQPAFGSKSVCPVVQPWKTLLSRRRGRQPLSFPAKTAL
jgi:hypothetical protein